MSHISRIFGTLALLGMLATFGPANAAQLQLNTGAPYLCAVVEGGNTASGTPVIAYSCSGGPEDQWNYVDYSFQGIGTANGKSMCLDVQGGVFAPGTLVVLSECSESLTQIWFTWWGGGAITLYYDQPLCLDSSGGPSVGGGSQLVTNTCTGAASQNWIVRGMQLASPTAPYLCANVKASKTANGTPVILYSCDDAPNELWDLENGQILAIGTENGASKCLTSNGSTIPIPVELSTCTGAQNQLWAIGLYSFGSISGANTLCLDRSGGTSGTQLVLNVCDNTASQIWNVR